MQPKLKQKEIFQISIVLTLTNKDADDFRLEEVEGSRWRNVLIVLPIIVFSAQIDVPIGWQSVLEDWYPMHPEIDHMFVRFDQLDYHQSKTKT